MEVQVFEVQKCEDGKYVHTQYRVISRTESPVKPLGEELISQESMDINTGTKSFNQNNWNFSGQGVFQ